MVCWLDSWVGRSAGLLDWLVGLSRIEQWLLVGCLVGVLLRRLVRGLALVGRSLAASAAWLVACLVGSLGGYLDFLWRGCHALGGWLVLLDRLTGLSSIQLQLVGWALGWRAAMSAAKVDWH